MADMDFYDVNSKKKFKTGDFKITERKGRFFAVAKSPSGTHECWRVVSKDTAAQFKK